MNTDLKLIAALLDYPTQLTVDILAEIDSLLGECDLIDEDGRRSVLEFANKYKGMDLLEWQQQYCATFDVAPSTSLYLFEHIYGSSRKRGAAMSSLKETYSDHGLMIDCNELPDYLPVYLDFLSRLSDRDEILSYIADITPILQSIYEVMTKNGIVYSLLIKPLIDIGSKGEPHPLPEVEATECPLAACGREL